MSVVKAEEAKQLWCPMSRVAQAGSVDISTAYNRTLTKEIVRAKVTVMSEDGNARPHDGLLMNAVKSVSMAANCIGKQCAMWRWSPEKTKKELQIVPNDNGGGDEVYVDVPTHGYCGLAGRPEVL